MLLKQGQKQDKKSKIQFFLIYILAILILAGLPCFFFIEISILGLIICFIISNIMWIRDKIAINLLVYIFIKNIKQLLEKL